MEADDKFILGLSAEATQHVLDYMGTLCPDYRNDCQLCAEVTEEARAVIRDGKERDERERD